MNMIDKISLKKQVVRAAVYTRVSSDDGSGYGEIIDELNRFGYKSKYGNNFAHNSLGNVVRNEKYTGVYVFNKLVSKNIDRKRNGNSYKDSEKIIRVEGVVPAIISREEFQIAQQKINSRKHSRAANNAKEVYLLSGKMRCGECGGAFVGSRKLSGRNKSLHITYRCSTRKNKHCCINKEIRREYIEAFVIDMLTDYVHKDDVIPKIVEKYKEYQFSKNSDLVWDRDNLSNRLNEITSEIDNLIIMASKVASEALVKRLTELEFEKAQIEADYSQIYDENDMFDVTIEKLTESFIMARSLLNVGKLSTIKKLIELYIDRVTVYKNHVNVSFKFHPGISIEKYLEVDNSKGCDSDYLTYENSDVSANCLDINQVDTFIIN